MMIKTDQDYFQEITKLVNLIRSKQPSTSLFLAMFETYPKEIWEKAVNQGIMTAFELQACMLALKQYRKLQAESAIKGWTL